MLKTLEGKSTTLREIVDAVGSFWFQHERESMTKEFVTIENMFAAVMSAGPEFSGGDENQCREIAYEWIYHKFSIASAKEWMTVGFWEASVAAKIRNAGITTESAKHTARNLVKQNGPDSFTSGSPIYAMCNGQDYPVEEFIRECLD